MTSNNALDVVEFGTVDEDVELRRSDHGAVVLVPASTPRMKSRRQYELAAELQRTVVELRRQQQQLDAVVLDARDAGVSWHVIGWSVGTTAEGARQRWGARAAEAGL